MNAQRVIEKNIVYYDKEYLIMLFPYEPYLQAYEGSGDVSSYYLISNWSYNYAKNRIEQLQRDGYIDAQFVKDIPFKQLISEAGLATIGKNSLAYFDELGSFFVIQAIEIGESSQQIEPDYTYNQHSCGECNNCVDACPTHAINSDGGLDATKCLRYFMTKGTCTDEERKMFDNKLLGCDICQNVCPKNAHIKPILVPDGVQQAFNIADLLNLVFEASTEKRESISEMIGANFARPRYLCALACISAGNSGDKKYIDTLSVLSTYDDKRISDNAIWALEQLTRA